MRHSPGAEMVRIRDAEALIVEGTSIDGIRSACRRGQISRGASRDVVGRS